MSNPRLLCLAVLTTGAMCGGVPQAMAAAYYIDGVAGKTSNPGTAALPLRDPAQLKGLMKPGDVVYVVPSMTYQRLAFVANGTAAAPITLAGSSATARTKVTGGGSNAGIWVSGNYLVVRNFDVTAPGAYPAISIAPYDVGITVSKNTIHDAGGDGVSAFSDDYLTISDNVVFGNAKNTTQFYGSGISILGSLDSDNYTGVKMVISGNIVYGNTNKPTCSTTACLATAEDSDGSGIILDDNKRLQFDNKHYLGGFLVENNVVYSNGGRGIHVFSTDNVVVTGNTVWKNNQDPYGSYYRPGEIMAYSSGNVEIVNNMLYGDGATGRAFSGLPANVHSLISFQDCVDGAGAMIAEYNLGYNPSADATAVFFNANNTNAIITGANTFADPKLESPTTSDFRFKPGSPAYQKAYAPLATSSDILGVRRTPLPSIGAYQNAGP